VTINNKNIQTYVKLPRSIVEKVDKEAAKENRSRSNVLANIIIDVYELKEEKG
jgi:hypothetical protein